MKKEDLFHLTIKTIISNQNNEILFLAGRNRTRSFLDLPGGRVNVYETNEQALLREIKEETGITEIHNIIPIGMIRSNHRIKIHSNRTVGLIFAFYTATTTSNVICISEEHCEFVWLDKAQATQALIQTYGPEIEPFLNK